MASREMELAALPQTSDPPRGLLSALPGTSHRSVPPGCTSGFQTCYGLLHGTRQSASAARLARWRVKNGTSSLQMAFTGPATAMIILETLSATSWRHVKFIEQFPPDNSLSRLVSEDLKPSGPGFSLDMLLNEPKEGRWLMMSDVCKHCVTAPCQQACPTGAIIHTEFENVFIQPDICNGCSSCVSACPFGVITRSSVDGHSHKCTLCYDRQRDGLVPACAKACPTAVDPVRPDR